MEKRALSIMVPMGDGINRILTTHLTQNWQTATI